MDGQLTFDQLELEQADVPEGICGTPIRKWDRSRPPCMRKVGHGGAHRDQAFLDWHREWGRAVSRARRSTPEGAEQSRAWVRKWVARKLAEDPEWSKKREGRRRAPPDKVDLACRPRDLLAWLEARTACDWCSELFTDDEFRAVDHDHLRGCAHEQKKACRRCVRGIVHFRCNATIAAFDLVREHGDLVPGSARLPYLLSTAKLLSEPRDGDFRRGKDIGT